MSSVATTAAVSGMNATIISNNMMQSAGGGDEVISVLVLYVVLIIVTVAVGCVYTADAKLDSRFASTEAERIMFHNRMIVRGIVTAVIFVVEILLMIMAANS